MLSDKIKKHRPPCLITQCLNQTSHKKSEENWKYHIQALLGICTCLTVVSVQLLWLSVVHTFDYLLYTAKHLRRKTFAVGIDNNRSQVVMMNAYS